ncbi:MAG: UDP-glucose 4-epimerase GalE [Clostridia bacterium]|nr:UDP-glucose 4-epimerase GalE [Clostridia bacterium]
MGEILLTGGAGFIGSHTATELIYAGERVVIADDLSNSEEGVLSRIEKITGARPAFYKINVADEKALDAVFEKRDITAAIHFAGFKAVGESVEKPLEYYENNIGATLSLLKVMKKRGCKRLVFSSSATVYGEKNKAPYTEDMETGGCTNPYGKTKFMIEEILKDAAHADKALSVVLLRYFNPIGAHESGLLGEKPNGIPNNLMPYITQTAAGVREKLSVFGNDYATPDGTGVRDYIHVVDLARGHLKALKYAEAHTGCETFNLGTGKGYSVLEVVNTFSAVNGVKVPYVIAPRRAGDLDICYADTKKAERLLGFKAEKDLSDMCRDSWRWQQNADKV